MAAADKEDKTGINRVIHEPARLMVLTALASSYSKEMSFTEIKDSLGFTGGNLSVQLKNLEDAGFVRISKRFEKNKPLTTIAISDKGLEALWEYLSGMEKLIASVKGAK